MRVTASDENGPAHRVFLLCEVLAALALPFEGLAKTIEEWRVDPWVVVDDCCVAVEALLGNEPESVSPAVRATLEAIVARLLDGCDWQDAANGGYTADTLRTFDTVRPYAARAWAAMRCSDAANPFVE